MSDFDFFDAAIFARSAAAVNLDPRNNNFGLRFFARFVLTMFYPRDTNLSLMKRLFLVVLFVSLSAVAGCSKSDKVESSVKPPSSPEAARLRSDSERLQQATANAARQREMEAQSKSAASPSPTP